jgi:hypothetical protein
VINYIFSPFKDQQKTKNTLFSQSFKHLETEKIPTPLLCRPSNIDLFDSSFSSSSIVFSASCPHDGSFCTFTRFADHSFDFAPFVASVSQALFCMVLFC